MSMSYFRTYVSFCQEKNQGILELANSAQQENVPVKPASASAPELAPTESSLVNL
jgi:hypothetical protein